ncbi:hypothetical protein R1flu_009511 [Riccia fluitans]|uniref:Expansin n=1 Tax=Riccia fluitans TaxID=41844 RepID=A0ABD1Z2A7_9MARC
MSVICVLVTLFSFGAILSRAQSWDAAHATYYSNGPYGGACGYFDISRMGYGTMTAALSIPLFSGGESCGACFRIRCVGDRACHNKEIVVTATNLCPQGSYGSWCDTPKRHFDLAPPAFGEIAEMTVGHVPIGYEKVTCARRGGIRFLFRGNDDWFQTLVFNVGGAGDVTAVSIRGANTGWISMTRAWGQNWEMYRVLKNQPLSFMVRIGDGRTVSSWNVANSDWQYGQTYEGYQF